MLAQFVFERQPESLVQAKRVGRSRWFQLDEEVDVASATVWISTRPEDQNPPPDCPGLAAGLMNCGSYSVALARREAEAGCGGLHGMRKDGRFQGKPLHIAAVNTTHAIAESIYARTLPSGYKSNNFNWL